MSIRKIRVDPWLICFNYEKAQKALTSNLLDDGGDGFLMFKKVGKYENTRAEILQSMVQ